MTKKFIVFLLVGILMFGVTAELHAVHQELPPEKHFTLVDEKTKKTIIKTGRVIHVGDEYIAPDNTRYEVVRIEKYTAYCKNKGKEEMPEIKRTSQTTSWFNRVIPVQADNDDEVTIAIYCTHSDESYIEGDGEESIDGRGGIYDVAERMRDEIEELGINVVYSDNNHNPHDVNAYHRSRRTATDLIKQDPAMKIDVHRDATPREEYEGEVDGEPIAQIKKVVGRSNPNSNTNEEFAKEIKAAMDEEKPGLSNGILIGQGDYNQDLSPQAILLEVGTHETPKDHALKAAEEFAEIVPTIVGVEAEPAARPLGGGDNQGAGTTLLIILIALGAAIGGFYLLNRGSSES
ncbi:Stage II sporulation protein P [Candidatus Syntrophocurvum alkaliphilum]|uniref:Stage II sporulation protein P n=1 Tax=Candidatus Syntrophocurvum alkaliphilum TaxID=2293317 RepID=A0A6I6DHM8_9FIRM|nr:stage II sporulation protein P [Candidatus Syntrophocurvum alkaliphilum]QGT99840.1 Stage II sporulation protein P [Candidatus Syntrophocurvum alkaliphilum]